MSDTTTYSTCATIPRPNRLIVGRRRVANSMNGPSTTWHPSPRNGSSRSALFGMGISCTSKMVASRRTAPPLNASPVPSLCKERTHSSPAMTQAPKTGPSAPRIETYKLNGVKQPLAWTFKGCGYAYVKVFDPAFECNLLKDHGYEVGSVQVRHLVCADIISYNAVARPVFCSLGSLWFCLFCVRQWRFCSPSGWEFECVSSVQQKHPRRPTRRCDLLLIYPWPCRISRRRSL